MHLLIPYPPGDAVDILGRTLAEELSEKRGQPVFIENRPGPGFLLAAIILLGIVLAPGIRRKREEVFAED